MEARLRCPPGGGGGQEPGYRLGCDMIVLERLDMVVAPSVWSWRGSSLRLPSA